MPVVTQTNRNQTWDPEGNLVTDEEVIVDVTAEAVEADVLTKINTALADNRTYLQSTPTQGEALAQVDALTRQVNGLIRLVVTELLDDATYDPNE